MADATTVFSVVGAIIAIGFLGNVLSKKTGFPDTLFLIIIGVILGPVFTVFPRDEMLPLTPFLAILTLMMILFEGGLNMEIFKVISQSFRAAILAVLYVSLSAICVSVFAFFVLKLGWLQSLMLGPMTAGTSSVVIIPLMNKLGVNKEVGVTLSLESTITDVLNIVVVITLLQMYLSGLVNVTQAASDIAARFAVGAVVGSLAGLIWIRVLALIHKEKYTYMLTIAVLALCYVGSETLGGSGSLSALFFGLVLGNYAEIGNILFRKFDFGYMTEIRRNVRKFHGELTFLIRAFFFVFLGLIYIPEWYGLLFAGIIVIINIVLRYFVVTVASYKSELRAYREFMTLMCGTGLANATLSVVIYNTLMAQTPPFAQAYLYPLIVANVMIMNNIVTSIAPLLMRRRQNV